MAADFPHTYGVSLSNIRGKQAQVIYESAMNVQGGPPKEFDGVDSDWSPEGFLVAGVALCFLTTLRAVHRDDKLIIDDLSLSASGILDKTTEGLVFTEIKVIAECATNDREAAKALMARAKKFCLISNALKTTPELDLTLRDVAQNS